MAEKAKVLVVANQTAESEELLAALKARADQGSVEFTVLIPATPHGVSWAADMHAGEEEAAYHRDALVERFRSIAQPPVRKYLETSVSKDWTDKLVKAAEAARQ